MVRSAPIQFQTMLARIREVSFFRRTQTLKAVLHTGIPSPLLLNLPGAGDTEHALTFINIHPSSSAQCIAMRRPISSVAGRDPCGHEYVAYAPHHHRASRHRVTGSGGIDTMCQAPFHATPHHVAAPSPPHLRLFHHVPSIWLTSYALLGSYSRAGSSLSELITLLDQSS
jgi:hypothetical protein